MGGFKMKIVFARLARMIAISLMFTSIGEAKIEKESIVGIWLFDESSGNIAKDSSDNNNDGKLMNGPESVAGMFGQALKFDGEDDYVEIPDSLILAPGEGDMTYTAWVKTTGVEDLYVYQNPVAKKDKSEWRVNAGKIRLYVRDIGGANTWRDSDSTF
jgi:hypothetical protein